MLVAKQKRSENIAEYILYLYQIEDLIRAFKFDIDIIEDQLIAKYQVDESTQQEIKDWYNNLVVMMEKERIQEKGHLQFLKNLMNDMNELHLKLLNEGKEKKYIQTYTMVSGVVGELKQKNATALNDIQLALDAIYGFLLLKIKKSKISDETAGAVKQFSQWLSLLSAYYKKNEEGKLEL